MKNPVSIYLEMFRTTVLVTFSKKDFLEVVQEWGSEEHEFDTDVSGLCWHDPSNGILVGVFEDGIKTLVHELTHASIFVLNKISANPTDSNGELMAYILEYLFRKATAKKTKQSRKAKRKSNK